MEQIHHGSMGYPLAPALQMVVGAVLVSAGSFGLRPLDSSGTCITMSLLLFRVRIVLCSVFQLGVSEIDS